METESRKTKVLGKISEIKSNIESFISDVNVNELKSSLNSMMKDAQKDFNKMVDKDLENVKKKLLKEKVLLEKKAKKFLDQHKKEIDALQAKFDKLIQTSKLKEKVKVKAKAKAPQAAKAAAPTATRKKASKKVAKVAKVASKKK